MNKYKEFIENEKKFSREFLEKLQIFDDRFNEEEYEFVKIIFKDDEFIDKIYFVIDDIISNIKEDYKIRFLVIGDFLFSMTCKELSDPSNLVLKTNRNDYINKIKLRHVINKIVGFDSDKYMIIHKKLLIGLRINNTLKRKQIRTLEDNSWETTIYMEINKDKINLENNIQIGFSDKPFILKKIGNKIYSMSSFRNIWETKRKKREMEERKISLKSVAKANRIKMFLSSEIKEINKNYIDNEKEKILKENKCYSYEDYFNKIIKIIKEDKYSEKIWFNRKENEYKKIMKNFQKIISFYILNKNIWDKELYLPCYMDNRGRQYYGTLISPTFYKIFRYMYEFANKKNICDLRDSKFYSEIIKYSHIIKEFNINDDKKYFAIVLLIEVGKFFVEKKIITKTEDIILSGLENYKKKNREINKEEIIYLNKIYSILDNLIKNNELKDTIIFKDATASGLQNYGIMLGYKEKMLEKLNIDGKNWCDTYQYLIDKFLEIDKNLNIDIEKLKKRKNWKSTIMTIPYNATWFTCFSRFLESLREEGIEYNDLDNKEKEIIKDIHKKFYENMKKNIKEEFYSNTKKEIIEFKYNKWTINEKKEYKINYKKERDKYREVLYTIDEDKESTLRALEANNMHYRDSELVKKIMEKYEILPIHDCFGIRLFELHKVMDEINDYYSKIIGKKTYCIHIII